MTGSAREDLRHELAVQNSGSADDWSLYETHRDAVHAALDAAVSAARTPEPRLVVLGAGNCNDLVLERVCARFDRVYLLDLDRSALDRALDRAPHPAQDGAADGTQDRTGGGSGRSGSPRLLDTVELLGDIDVSGLADLEPGLPAARYAAALQSVQPPPTLREQGDVVLSAGLYSQLVQLLLDRARHDEHMPRLVRLLRDRHLRYLCALLAPGGVGVLTFETVSSQTLPALATASGARAVARLLEEALRDGNFFTGGHPAAVAESLEELRATGVVRDVRPLPPWRWTFGATHHYAAMGFLIRRGALAAGPTAAGTMALGTTAGWAGHAPRRTKRTF